MIKKILCILTSLTLCLGMLTSCADSSSSSSGTASVSSTQSSGKDSSSGEKDKKDNNKTKEEEKASVDFSQKSGVYAEAFSLELSTTLDGEIYYTTDGSDPSTSDTAVKYEGAIEIKDRKGDANVVSAVGPEEISGNFVKWKSRDKVFESTVSAPDDDAVDKCSVINAAVKGSDGSFSPVAAATYFIGTPEEHIQGIKESCEAMGTDLAVISITMDYDDLFDADKGIYVKGNLFDEALSEHLEDGEDTNEDTARRLPANYNQRGKDWERNCRVDFLEYNADGAETAFSQSCGIRIQGNYSRSDWQKGFRLYARSDYGKKNFKYAVFGDELKDDNGDTIDKFKTLELRAGGNCAFTCKFNDIYWQDLSQSLDCETKASRPCVVYLNGEYWGLYVLEEDYSDDYFEDHHGVNKDDVVVYKGDAETYKLGYKLDEGMLPEGEKKESYFFNDLNAFFKAHKDLTAQEDFDEFAKLVDTDSVRDYFLAEVWINNKWDWPGKNWSMWKTANVDESNEYADGRWRFMFYDMEFGGVSGSSDSRTNTVKEDNYKPKGLLDMGTNNPAVLCFAYAMTNEAFRNDFNEKLEALSSGIYEKENANAVLDSYTAQYSPLFDQFFERYPGSGDSDNAVYGGYASVQCIKDFIEKREDNITKMTKWINKQF
ncbi:MAG: CotH kinase family protein [Ruminococcus sp.]|nr:CotH kinase family protein [Ruminococcus sp.]